MDNGSDIDMDDNEQPTMALAIGGNDDSNQQQLDTTNSLMIATRDGDNTNNRQDIDGNAIGSNTTLVRHCRIHY